MILACLRTSIYPKGMYAHQVGTYFSPPLATAMLWWCRNDPSTLIDLGYVSFERQVLKIFGWNQFNSAQCGQQQQKGIIPKNGYKHWQTITGLPPMTVWVSWTSTFCGIPCVFLGHCFRRWESGNDICKDTWWVIKVLYVGYISYSDVARFADPSNRKENHSWPKTMA